MSKHQKPGFSASQMDQLLDQLFGVPDLELQEIPNIDLYMDQVTTFINEHLASAKRSEEDKILTKTMINNYAKHKLLPPPVKKKYSREHLLVMLFIYYFKGTLSLQDIQSLLGPLTERYFHAADGLDLSGIYEETWDSYHRLTPRIRDDISAFIDKASSSFPDAPEEERPFLQYFSLICSLCLDVYMKKRMLELMIDGASNPDENGRG